MFGITAPELGYYSANAESIVSKISAEVALLTASPPKDSFDDPELSGERLQDTNVTAHKAAINRATIFFIFR